jgi:23S rRNA (uracil1939-C5)-methyltransferase
MVIVQFAYDDPEAIQKVMEFVRLNFPQVTSLQYVVNSKGNDTFFDQDVKLYAGDPFIIEEMEDLQFRVGPKSFFQTNAAQALVLYKIARDFANLQGHEVVYDLYTGTGTIANFVARQAKKVVGIDYIEAVIKDAEVNSQINNIDNTSFFAGDIKDVLHEDFLAAHGKPDVIITDPPRAGMHVDVVQALIKMAPLLIVYVSCNPATQARDIALLDGLYEVKAVQPVDMFPHTYHVENVLLLERR